MAHSQQLPAQSEGSSLGHCVEVGKFGLEGEIEQLKRDKNVLMMELVRLRQQQQSTERELRNMGQRLQSTEQRQQQMMTFLAKVMQSPAFLSQLMQQSESKQFRDTRKKRRLPKQEDDGEDGSQSASGGQLVKYAPGFNESFYSTFLQILNSNQEELLSNPLEASSEQPQDMNVLQGRATLTEYTELQAPPGLVVDMPDPVVDDVSNETEVDLASLVLPDFQAKEYHVSFPNTATSDAVDSDPVSLETEFLIQTEEASPSIMSSEFWDQFLASSKETPDAETDQAGEVLQGSILEDWDLGSNQQLWSTRDQMDELVQQLGQLEHGSNL